VKPQTKTKAPIGVGFGMAPLMEIGLVKIYFFAVELER
jgi:hypothetical protein